MKSILVIIALTLVCILGLMIHEARQPETPGEQLAESINDAANEIGEAIEDVGNEMQDASRGR